MVNPGGPSFLKVKDNFHRPEFFNPAILKNYSQEYWLNYSGEVFFSAIWFEEAKRMEKLIESFLDHLRDLNYSPLTVLRYERILFKLRGFLREAHGQNQSEDVFTRPTISAFLQRDSQEKRHSAETRNLELAALRTFFNYLIDEGIVSQNPTLKIEFARQSRKLPVYLSHEEYREFIEVVRRHTRSQLLERNLALVVVLYNTGMRVSEVVSLNLDMINWQAHEFQGVAVKGGEVVNIPFNSEVPERLKDWLKQRRKMELPPAENALFVTRKGKRLSVRHIEHIFSYYSRKWGKKKVTPHVLRHSMATELAARGENIEVISQILHHKSLNTTKIYLHLAEDSKKKALERLVQKKEK